MAQDWLFETQDGVCHFRCGGLLIRDGKVLLQRDGGVYALPGGHVAHGETGAQAVEREFMEELGLTVRCGRMLWSEESFWQWQGRLHHTVSFTYLAETDAFPDDGAFHPAKDNPRIEMGWVKFDDLAQLTVYPEYLKDRIRDLSPGHFITYDM